MTSFRSLRRSSAALVAVGALTFGAAACAEDEGTTTDETAPVDDGAMDDGAVDDGAMDDGAVDEGELDDGADS